MTSLVVATEGVTDRAILARVCREIGVSIGRAHGEQGKDFLDARLPGFNRAARHSPWVVLRDLDTDADCAPALARTLLPTPARRMVLCLAVREVEAWLLADRAGFARSFGVVKERVPMDPGAIEGPKAEIVRLARRSRFRRVRDDIVPPSNSGAAVGPGHTARLIEFAGSRWDPQAASRRSPSLRRCLARIAALGAPNVQC